MHQPPDFFYTLPPSQVAQTPVSPRDQAKLMVINRRAQTIAHHSFSHLTRLLTANDILVLNNSKVFPARLIGTKSTGGMVEVFLLQPEGDDVWKAIARGIKTAKIVHFGNQLTGYVIHKNDQTGDIKIRLEASVSKPITSLIDKIGKTPIPPYIRSPLSESKLRQEYQTIYAKDPGSAAAPTAGLHFTESLLDELTKKGVQIEQVTLHVGLGTFAKLQPENLTTKTLHHEWYSINQDTTHRLNQAKISGKRIVAVGTTTCRVLESANQLIDNTYQLKSGSYSTNIFIMPPYKFKFVDSLITNFHLPESSLLMMVTAFTQAKTFKQSLIETAYLTAIDQDYRFFSFGDAMLIE